MKTKKIIWLWMCFGLLMLVSSSFAAKDIMEVMFQPAKEHEKIIDLGADKNAVGNEVFRQSTQLGVDVNFSNVCIINGQKTTDWVLSSQAQANGYAWSTQDYCEKVLWGTYDTSTFDGTAQQQAPLLVRITKFLLRITMVLSITMVLYNGVMWIVESAKWGDVKDAKDNLIYIVSGILLALSSVALVNLVSSISLNSLTPENMPDTQNSPIVSQ